MGIVNVSFSYQIVNILKTHPNLSEIREEFPEMRIPEILEEPNTYWPPDIFVTEEEFWKLVNYGLKPEAQSIKGMVKSPLPPQMTNGDPPPSGASIYNISVPNASLQSVQTLTYLEDACTDSVQAFLNRGWRIVAVCPPNDCRRPTYILGHFDLSAT